MVDHLASVFSATPLDTHYAPDVEQRIWHKVLFNAGMNATSALSRATPGAIGESDGAKEMVRSVIREGAAVAAACGINVDVDAIYATVDMACKDHADHVPSMLQDLTQCRRTEVEAINGALVARGREHGIATPLNEMLRALVLLAERANDRTSSAQD